jgi:hypothetical protein
MNPHLFDSQDDRISCMNALSFYYHQVSAAETASDMYEKWKQEGIKYLNMADNIHSQSKETWTTKAYYWITQGQLKQAQNYLVNLRQVVQQT